MVDASAIVSVLLEDPPVPELAERLSGQELFAPHLLDVEFLHALRRLVAGGRVPAPRAEDIRANFASVVIVRYPHGLLLGRMWDLRDNLTAYDAAYVALSEVLDLPLITTDSRMAAAPGHHAVIEAY